MLFERMSSQKVLRMRRISAQQSEASFSSQQRPRETAEVSAEPEEEQDPPAEPQTFKEKFLDKLKGMSIMPSPERALETCQEDTGAFLWQTQYSLMI